MFMKSLRHGKMISPIVKQEAIPDPSTVEDDKELSEGTKEEKDTDIGGAEPAGVPA